MNLRSVFLEAFLVALGVVLGLAASEWRSERQDREDALDSLESIRDEIRHNRDLVIASRDYHQERLQAIHALASQGDGARPSLEDFSRGFVFPARVVDTAWETAKLTDAISNLPLDVVLTASHVYQLQEVYREQLRTFGPVLYSIMMQEGTRGVMERYQNLGGIIAGFLYRESELVGTYDEALSALDPAP